MEVKDFASSVITFEQSFIMPINVGDTFDVWAGCDKTMNKCVNFFNNLNNFRGFNSIPGADIVTSGMLI